MLLLLLLLLVLVLRVACGCWLCFGSSICPVGWPEDKDLSSNKQFCLTANLQCVLLLIRQKHGVKTHSDTNKLSVQDVNRTVLAAWLQINIMSQHSSPKFGGFHLQPIAKIHSAPGWDSASAPPLSNKAGQILPQKHAPFQYHLNRLITDIWQNSMIDCGHMVVYIWY